MSLAVILSIIGGILTIISFLGAVFGIGWKLHSELSSIRTMIETFIAKAEEKWISIEKLERRVEKLEDSKCFHNENKS